MDKKKPTVREIVVSSILIAIVGVFFILNIVIPAPTVLRSERRLPARFPDLSVKSVVSGEFMSGFESYAADRFVFRDAFRAIHAFMVFDIYQQTDKSGIYRCDAVGAGEFRRTNPTAFRQTSERIKRAIDSLDGLDMNIYYSIVPDKSYFAERFMPGFDLAVAESIITEVLREQEYIRLMESLEAASFYRTDLHWDQSRIQGAANHILTSMGASPANGEFPVMNAGEWYGVYAGQLALPIAADSLKYVDVPGLRASYLNDRTLEFDPGPVYDIARFSGVDPYDIFLRGPQPLIIIENDAAPERELYLFRDSFGSSLAPLLAESYSRVTVIDLRYINLQLLHMPEIVGFDLKPETDVLFIFSSQIFNNPSILQT